MNVKFRILESLLFLNRMEARLNFKVTQQVNLPAHLERVFLFMEGTKFIFQIESEQTFAVLNRITSHFSRRRIPIRELQAVMREGDEFQTLTIAISDTRENAILLSKRIEREIDVVTVKLFEPTS